MGEIPRALREVGKDTRRRVGVKPGLEGGGGAREGMGKGARGCWTTPVRSQLFLADFLP